MFDPRKYERLAAHTCLACLAAAGIGALIPDAVLARAPVSWLLTVVGALLLVTWVYLLFVHVGRMINRWPYYGIRKALFVLFVPFFGVIFASLHPE